MIYDFHMHTTYSDGGHSAEEVVGMAKEAKVDIMCLTDHDTMLSMDKAKELDAAESNIKIHGALEISTHIYSIDKHAHILAYRCDRDNKALNELVEQTQKNRTESFYKSIEIINKKGEVKVDLDEIENYKGPNGFFTRHVMDYLIDIGYDDEISTKARKMFNPSNGYAFVDFVYPECTKAIEIVRNAGGIPILAHSFSSGNFSGVEELLEAGLMGIEAFHPRHTEEQMQILFDFCKKRNLLVTCGSDFHRVIDKDHKALGSMSVENDKIREFVSFLDK